MGAFGEGWFGGLRGADPRECPYDKMTREWNAWQRGLRLAVETFI